MRMLVLFDIDGTLIRGGPAKESFRLAMLETFGTAGPIDGHDFSGKTDPEIARELLEAAGVPDAAIEEGLARLWTRYAAELERRLPLAPVTVLPGVPDLLGALESLGDVALGLVTGNIARGARLKLESAGLDHCFAVGGFGSDHEVRGRLPAIAMRRAARNWGVTFPPASVVVVGDTPRDVACGRDQGTRTVAVATGAFQEEALRRAGADHVFPDLSATSEILAALEEP